MKKRFARLNVFVAILSTYIEKHNSYNLKCNIGSLRKLCNMSNNNNNNIENAKRRLAIFDFDCTIIEGNSDDVVQQLLPTGPITQNEREFIKQHGWTKFMAKVFQLLHDNKVTPAQIRQKIQNIPEVPGMVNMLQTLQNKHMCELIIVSDANSIFICEWLMAQKLDKCISSVFTNPATFDEQGHLQIQPYHWQTECTLSAPNLCKGKVVEQYVQQHATKFEQLIYVGDGQNDICPALRLTAPHDIVCARKGYGLVKYLEKEPEKYALKAKLVVWQDGYELLRQLESNLV